MPWFAGFGRPDGRGGWVLRKGAYGPKAFFAHCGVLRATWSALKIDCGGPTKPVSNPRFPGHAGTTHRNWVKFKGLEQRECLGRMRDPNEPEGRSTIEQR